MYLPRLNPQVSVLSHSPTLKEKQIDPQLLGIIAVTPHVKNQKGK
jgi:hypothetical protein